MLEEVLRHGSSVKATTYLLHIPSVQQPITSRRVLQQPLDYLHNLNQLLVHHRLSHNLHMRRYSLARICFVYLISLVSIFLETHVQDVNLQAGSYTTPSFANSPSFSFFALPALRMPAGQFSRFANTV
jgi:hypothetical protein